MTHHGRVAVPVRQLNGLNRFRQRSDLVDFDENTVGNTFVDSLTQAVHVGHEQVVADKLQLFSQFIGQSLPALPVVF